MLVHPKTTCDLRTPPLTDTQAKKQFMTAKSALRQLPEVLVVFDAGLFAFSAEMVL
jgi:hypothetical protein